MLPVPQDLYRPFKLNVAAIGNIVSQLHVHVTGRLQVIRLCWLARGGSWHAALVHATRSSSICARMPH